MTILNGETLGYRHGLCIKFLYRDAPLAVDETGWAPRDPRETYQSSIIFELAEDMLGALCGLVREYSPFDPYAVTNISRPDDLSRLLTVVERWLDKLSQAPDERIRCLFDIFFDELTPSFTTDMGQVRRDLTETITFLADKIRLAIDENRVISIVGI
jgi:hypothetical protein